MTRKEMLNGTRNVVVLTNPHRPKNERRTLYVTEVTNDMTGSPLSSNEVHYAVCSPDDDYAPVLCRNNFMMEVLKEGWIVRTIKPVLEGA